MDILIPKLHLAIEFNGDHWHEEGTTKPIGYHEMKTKFCKEKGITLIHIWEHDWINDRENILKKLKNIILN